MCLAFHWSSCPASSQVPRARMLPYYEGTAFQSKVDGCRSFMHPRAKPQKTWVEGGSTYETVLGMMSPLGVYEVPVSRGVSSGGTCEPQQSLMNQKLWFGCFLNVLHKPREARLSQQGQNQPLQQILIRIPASRGKLLTEVKIPDVSHVNKTKVGAHWGRFEGCVAYSHASGISRLLQVQSFS